MITITKKKELVFVVNVFIAKDNKLITIVKNIPIYKPVEYKHSIMKKACLRDNSKIRKLVKNKGWGVEIVKWY